MRYNKHELVALVSQTSQNFDREGVLLIKERQEGFFRRSEGFCLRWFRLRGNLLFYLKGPEPWQDPLGVIVLGQHQVKLHNVDENGWPFQIDWENGACCKMATLHESERTLWVKAIQSASYEDLRDRVSALKDKINSVRPIVEIATYRLQKGIVIDMNEVPLCELAISCDNLLCNSYGKPPSTLVVIFVKYSKGPCIQYGSTETVENCSNPCFSKTILCRASDGLNGDTIIRIVAYDVKEKFSETIVPFGFTALKLSTIQDSQRLRVALSTRDNKTVGFITIQGWSLEPSYIGTSPSHTNDKNSIEIPQKISCHRRAHSLPPRLGLKLKFPSYGSLLKQNFSNSYQVTYRFHSGLGGDITVHEIMAEPKICYHMPVQLLEIYIQREKELLEELLSIGELNGNLQCKQIDLVNIHISLLKQYSHSKRCMQYIDCAHFKASSRKDESSLEFAPINLHLQRMWVHNDTLNKAGSHDVITAGAFAAHSQKAEKSGGLIRLVQQVKDIQNSKAASNQAASNKIQNEFDNVIAFRKLKDEISDAVDKIAVLAQARQKREIIKQVEGGKQASGSPDVKYSPPPMDICNPRGVIDALLPLNESLKNNKNNLLQLWDPNTVEESLSYIGWPKTNNSNYTENQPMSTIRRITDQINSFDTQTSDYETLEMSSSCSSKETSPIVEMPSLSSSVPNIFANNAKQQQTKTDKMTTSVTNELSFHNDYFINERDSSLNHSFRSVRAKRVHNNNNNNNDSGIFNYKRCSSLRNESYTSMERVSAKSMTGGSEKKKILESLTHSKVIVADPVTRKENLNYFMMIKKNIEESIKSFLEGVSNIVTAEETNQESYIDEVRSRSDLVKVCASEAVRWMRVSHASMRLRCDTVEWSSENAALQYRRDVCFSQALTAVTSGLLCWLCSVPADIVVKILSSNLGPLCEFEGLLSLYSNEKAMWGDMVVAVEDLQTVVFKLVKVGHSNSSLPHVIGTRGSLVVNIPVADSLYSKFTSKEHLKFTITAVFFNIGINEKATLAEALGETTPQHQSNCDNLDRLNKYFYKYGKAFPGDINVINRASSRTKPLEEVMENLSISVQKKVSKNVEVLQLAALATRLMNGVRFTSCKSAKDRTGMSVTLEQCSILASEYHLAEHEVNKALKIMRSEGCRRENSYKNIGVRKYAFTKKQVAALPESYRPPIGTYGSTQT